MELTVMEADMWKGLPESEKARYKDRARRLLEDYHRTHSKIRYRGGGWRRGRVGGGVNGLQGGEVSLGEGAMGLFRAAKRRSPLMLQQILLLSRGEWAKSVFYNWPPGGSTR
jgi:hypothetical protein